MNFPAHFIEHLKNTSGFDATSFEAAHQKANPVSIRYNPFKNNHTDSSLEKIPWTSHGYYLPVRPSFVLDPLWHAGVYYVQEASSMFLEHAVKQTIDLNQKIKVLDLCAAPGGKSTLLQSVISKESLLVCNEVIQSRVSILRENIIKWGGKNTVVTNNDPADFKLLQGYFDLVVVDAPCSGSGLFRRDISAMDEWSMDNVQLCAGRQQRILADIISVLKQEGVLIYSTCSYSAEENEQVLDWLLQNFEMESVPLLVDKDWGIMEVITGQGGYGYRCWPDKVKGEGFFMAVLKKRGDHVAHRIKVKKYNSPSAKEKIIANAFIQSTDEVDWIMQGKYMSAILPDHYEDIQYLMERLRVRYAGVEAGTIIHDSFMPEHPLAVASELFPNIPMYNMTEQQALLFLRKEEIAGLNMPKGLQWVGYKDCGLGWVKSLGNRINNYYPKEWRIRQKV